MENRTLLIIGAIVVIIYAVFRVGLTGAPEWIFNDVLQ